MLHYEAIESGTLELLKELSSLPVLKDFALVGGTGLALQLGHRLSVDLDFFTLRAFSVDDVLASLEANFEVVVVGRAEQSLNCMINGVKADLMQHRYALLKEVLVDEPIRLWSIEDIAAAKISAISNRGAKKDFYDVVEILTQMPMDTILSCFERKYPSAERFMAIKSLSWFEDAECEPDPISLKGLEWSEVKHAILESLKDVAL